MVSDTRRLLVAVGLAVLVVFAGCSGGMGDSSSPETAGGGAAEQSADATVAKNDDASRSQEGDVRQRALIRKGTVRLTVDEYGATSESLAETTRELGGFVSDTDENVHTRGDENWTTGKLVLRVPKENFSTLLDRTKSAGEVREASTSTNDVTDQLVDVEARLENLRTQRDRLRELYDEANDTENVLQVQERLSEVQTEIERLEAQQESLQRKVAYSTLTVQLDERAPDGNPSTEGGMFDTGLLSAFVSSLHGVVVVARGLAVAAAYAAPYVLAFGVPVVAGVKLWRGRGSRNATGAELPESPDSPSEADLPDEDD